MVIERKEYISLLMQKRWNGKVKIITGIRRCGKSYLPPYPQSIGFSGILLTNRQNSFYCTYSLHNRNVADIKSPYPTKRLEVIRRFNQKSIFLTKVCLEQVGISIVVWVNVQYVPTWHLNPFWKFRSCHRRCVPCHYKDIRTSESVGFYYIDNQTLCISIPRWHLWFELKEHQMFRKLRNNLKIVRSLRTVSNCFFLFLGPIIAVSLTNVRMIWTKPCSLQERHGKITLFIVQEFHKSCSFQFSGNPIATISIFGYSSNRTFILLRKVFDGLIMFKRYWIIFQ